MKALFPIVPRAKIWITLGFVIMAVCLFIFIKYQRYSIQFTGGIEMVLDTPTVDTKVIETVNNQLIAAGFTPENVSLGKKDDFATLLVQLPIDDDAKVQTVTSTLKKALTESKVIDDDAKILEQSVIGPSIGAYMKRSAFLALIWGLILVSVYILFSFSGMRKLVSPALIGTIILLTMLFDVMFPAGMYGIWMASNHAIQIDAIFIISLLTVMGYSLNDTIIIFDRVRENFITQEESFEKGKMNITSLFEDSLWQTMRRSLGTSVVTMMIIILMRFLGTGALKMFAFTFGMGVVSGTFSSIFFAAPLAYLFAKKTLTEKKK